MFPFLRLNMWLNVKKEEMYALKTDAEISTFSIIAAKYEGKRKNKKNLCR